MFHIFAEGDAYYRDLISSIDRAKLEIVVESYIIEPDDTGNKILGALWSASERGVTVKILVDGIGSYRLISEWSFVNHDSFLFRIFRPVRIHNFFHFKNHRRNHRKLVVIDKEILYIGGVNISNVHSMAHYGSKRWRDMMIRIEGQIALTASQSFERLWTYTEKGRMFLPRKTLHHGGEENGFLLIENIPYKNRRKLRKFFLRSISSAKEYVLIQNAYFLPDLFLLRRLRAAVKRGVRVCLLLNSESDVTPVLYATRALYEFLIPSGIEVHEFRSRFSHTKLSIIDNTVYIGSSNLDPRSFFYNLELDCRITNPLAVQIFKEQFFLDLWEASPVREDKWKKRPFTERLKEKFFLLFRNYL